MASERPSLDRYWLPAPPSTSSSLSAVRTQARTFPSPPLRVSRVGQLDAALLDNELEGILGGPVWKALEGIKGPGRRHWDTEMMAVLRIAILWMSLVERGATYGSMLQNLKYRNEWRHATDNRQYQSRDSPLLPAQKIAYIAFQVLPSYLHSKLRYRMLSTSWSDLPLPRTWFSLIDIRRLNSKSRHKRGEEQGQWRDEWKRVVWEFLLVGERLAALAGLANFLTFLYDGRYRTLMDRILGMRLVYAQRSLNRNVSFEFLNRQLVWEAFTEFLLFLVPLINLHRLRLRFSRLLQSAATRSRLASSVLSSLPLPVLKALRLPIRRGTSASQSIKSEQNARKAGEQPHGTLHMLPSTTCPVCYSAASAPPTSIPSADPTSSSAQQTTISSQVQDTSVQVPYLANCAYDCRYCYYCIVGKLVETEEEGEESWICLRCGGDVTGCEREKLDEEILATEEPMGAEEPDDDGTIEESERGTYESATEGEEVGDGQDAGCESEVGSVSSQHDNWR